MQWAAMSDFAAAPSRRVLEPIERISEGLFGLIMVLTFTGSLSVAEIGRDDVRAMLVAALGCNFAWGIIDAVMYLMAGLAERARELRVVRAVRAAADARQVQAALANVVPGLAALLQPAELEALQQRARELPEPPARARLGSSDWRGGLGVFLVVFLITLPVALPFVFVATPGPALRLSNLVAIVLLFALGCAYGRTVGRRPLPMGIAMVVFGVAIVAMTMALGG